MSGSVERKVAYRAPSCCICSAVRSCTLPTEAAASGVERLRLHLQFLDQKKHIEFGHFQQRSSKGPKLKATLHLLCSAPLLMFFLRLLFFKRRDSSFFCKGKYFVIIISPNRSSLRHHEPIAQAHSAFSDFIQPIHHSP